MHIYNVWQDRIIPIYTVQVAIYIYIYIYIYIQPQSLAIIINTAPPAVYLYITCMQCLT